MAGKLRTPLIKQFGFTPARRRTLLEFIGFDAADRKHAVELQRQIITPNVDAIVDEFYVKLGTRRDARRLLQNRDMTRLRATLREYLLTLGKNFESIEYIEGRLKVGATHARISVSPALYLASYNLLTQSIMARLPARKRKCISDRFGLAAFLVKVTTLDMCLAIETYHTIRVGELQHSIQSLRGKNARWHRLAHTDRSTGLVNQTKVLELLATELDKSNHAPVATILCDVDRFKSINDRLGHVVGDKVLRGITERLQSAARNRDVVGRYGGDEFLIVLKDTSVETALEVAERLRLRVRGEPLDISGLSVGVTLSLGVAGSLAGDNAESLIARADAALYRAKHAGRNCVHGPEIFRSPDDNSTMSSA